MPERLLAAAGRVHAAAGAVTALAASPWAPLVAVAGQKQVLLYNTDTRELLGVLPFPEGMPHVLKFSRNGTLLLAGGGRGGQSGKVVAVRREDRQARRSRSATSSTPCWPPTSTPTTR